MRIARLREIDVLVTDRLDARQLDLCRRNDVEVVQAGEPEGSTVPDA